MSLRHESTKAATPAARALATELLEACFATPNMMAPPDAHPLSLKEVSVTELFNILRLMMVILTIILLTTDTTHIRAHLMTWHSILGVLTLFLPLSEKVLTGSPCGAEATMDSSLVWG